MARWRYALWIRRGRHHQPLWMSGDLSGSTGHVHIHQCGARGGRISRWSLHTHDKHAYTWLTRQPNTLFLIPVGPLSFSCLCFLSSDVLISPLPFSPHPPNSHSNDPYAGRMSNGLVSYRDRRHTPGMIGMAVERVSGVTKHHRITQACWSRTRHVSQRQQLPFTCVERRHAYGE